MGDYSSSIKKLNNQLLTFINRYEILEEKDPISNALLKRLKKQINSLNTTSNHYVQGLNKQLIIFNSFFDSAMENYKVEKIRIEGLLETSLDVITQKYEKKVQQLNEEIVKLTNSTQEKLDELNQDIQFFFIGSKQREDTFETECEENLRHYQYQISNAEESYNQLINQYNEDLTKRMKSLNKSYESSLINFDENINSNIKKAKEEIEKCNLELQAISEKLTHERNLMKEKFRQESILLNQKIKKLSAERNKDVDEARTKYTKDQNASAIEKENRRQNYQVDSQIIQKDFVKNMTDINNTNSDLKTRYIQQLEFENRKYNYRLLDLHKSQDKEIKNIVEMVHITNKEYNKYVRHLIKSKNKVYYKLSSQIKNEQFKTIKNLDNNYQLEMETSRHQQANYEMMRNYSLKILTEKEQSDNKYFQQESNIHENDMSLKIQTSNLNYNKNANTVKTKSVIRNKELEKELDIKEANFQIKIEEIQTNINKNKLEIDGIIELQKLVHKFEESNYKMKANHFVVTTLLEIEKCKMLDQFNHRQYQHNVLNAKTILAYGKKKLEIENQQFENLTNIKISKLQSILQRDIINATYKIKEDQIYEAEDKKIENRNAQYELDFINHTVLYERFKAELKIIHQILSVFILLIREMENFTVRVLSIFFTSISIRPNYLDIINVFIRDFLKIITSYYSNLVSNLNEHECEIIYKRIDFEEKFKFKSYYKDLLDSYENERKKLLNKKKSITDTLENYLRTIESFRTRIFNFNTQNNLLKQRMNTSIPKEQKDNLKKEYQATKQKIWDAKKKIEDIQKLKSILSKDDAAISNELRILDKDYNRRVEEIKKMQYNSAISFYDLRRNLSRYSTYINQRIELLNNGELITIRYNDVLVPVNAYRNELVQFNTNIFKDLYNIVDIFYVDTSNAMEKDKKYLLIKFKNDVDQIHIRTNNEIEENKKEYSKKVSFYLQELKNLDNKYMQEEKRFASYLQKNDEDYEQQIKQIIEDRKQSMARFYTEFYAMSDNLTDIKETEKIEKEEREKEFQNEKLLLSQKITKEKEDFKTSLDNFIQAKKELIDHLSPATKFQSQQLEKESKEINTDIENQIKNIKINAAIEKKIIERNISNIKFALDQTLLEIDVQHRRNSFKEEQLHLANVKRIEKNINIVQD